LPFSVLPTVFECPISAAILPISCRNSQRLPIPADPCQSLPVTSPNHRKSPTEFCRSLLFFSGHYIATAQLVPGFGGNSAGPCIALLVFICHILLVFPAVFEFISLSVQIFCLPILTEKA